MKSASEYPSRRALLVAGSVVMAAAAAPEIMAQNEPRYGIEGQQTPEIYLDYWIDKDGDPGAFSVSESRGKWLFLSCFQDWCPGCHSSELPTLKAFSDEFASNSNVEIAGIQTVFEGFSSNTVEDVRKLQLKYELPITMGHDPGNPQGDHRPQTMRKYRTGGTPWLILIDPDGTVVYNHFRVNSAKLIEYVHSQIG